MIISPVLRPGSAHLIALRVRKALALARRPSLWGGFPQVVPALEHSHVPFRDDIRTVIDVGASYGQFARFALDRWPDAGVMCFEPLPAAAAKLRSLPAERVTVSETALSADESEAELHVSARDDSSSLLPIGARQISEFPGTQETASITVRKEMLDSAVRPRNLISPALLKIDVQGTELDVLKGAILTLETVSEVYVECSFVELYEGQALAGDVVAFLQRAGFQLRGVYNLARGRGGHCVQADLFFASES